VTDRAPTAREFPDTPAVVTVPALLSVATVARLLDCSARTVRRRITERSLPAVVDGRVLVRGDELRQYIDRLERVEARPGRARRAAPRGAPTTSCADADTFTATAMRPRTVGAAGGRINGGNPMTSQNPTRERRS
jgi:excisionase family DNA binding protein